MRYLPCMPHSALGKLSTFVDSVEGPEGQKSGAEASGPRQAAHD